MSQRRIGALLSYVSIFLSTIIGFFLAPFIVKSLGDSEYGVYILIGSFSSYLVIINAALSDTTIRYLVKYEASKDTESQKNIMGLMFCMNVLLAIVVNVVGLYLWYKIPMFFKDTFNNYEIKLARQMLLVILINLSSNIVLNVFQGAIIAKERFIFLKSLDILSEILTNIMIVVVLLLGYKAISVVIITSIVGISIMLMKTGYYFIKIRIGINLKPTISKNQLKELAFYAIPLIGIIVADQIYWKLDNILIGLVSGTKLITVYSIGMAFHKYFMRFSTVISKIVMPNIILKVDMGSNANEMTDILIKVSRIQAIILMLVMSGLITFGKDFIYLWMGEEYSDAYYIMLCTLIPYSLELIGNVRNILMQSKGIYWKRMIVMIIVSLLNVLLTIILLKLIGIVGAAIATGLGIIISYILTTYILKKDLSIETYRYFKELSSGILSVVILLIAIGVLLNVYNNLSWTTLFIKIFIYTIIYIIIMYKFGINEYEKSLVLSFYKIKSK